MRKSLGMTKVLAMEEVAVLGQSARSKSIAAGLISPSLFLPSRDLR